MSDYRAIAGVSSSLRNLLRDRMDDFVLVTIAPPDVTVTGVTGRRLNLCLYLITENGYLKNQEIPGHGYPNTYGHPPLSLVLHYLLTAHGENETGADADLQAQQVLGDAMRVLHDFAIVDSDLVFTRAGAGTVGTPILDTSLLNEFERVKVCLQPTSLDDFSRIWTALHQSNFRLSVAYEVSVIQIESRDLQPLAMPVKSRRVHVAPLRRPEISAVYRTPAGPSDPVGDPRAHVLQQITLEGLHFVASRTWVRLGGLEPIGVVPASDIKLQFAVPDDTYPPDPDHPASRPIPPGDRLQPGPTVVQVIARRATEVVQGGLDPGSSGSDMQVQTSNNAVFMLVPQITATSPASGPAGTVLTVQGRRLWDDRLHSVILVGDVPLTPLAPGGSVIRTPTEVQVRVEGLAPGATYPVRAFVNGAASLEDAFTFEVTP